MKKRIISFIMACTFFVSQFSTMATLAAVEMEENEYCAIETKNFYKQGSKFSIGGKINEVENVTDFHTAIVDGLDENTIVEQQSYQWNGDTVDNEESIFCKEDIAINCNTANMEDIIFADKSITVNATTFASDAYTIVYARHGDITINVSEMDFQGLLYAPDGKVVINGSDISIQGSIVSSEVYLYVNSFEIAANENTQSILDFLGVYRNDSVLTLSAYTDETDICVIFEPDREFESVDVYIRKDNADSFTWLGNTTEDSYWIKDTEFDESLDIMAVAKTQFGDTFDSTVISVGYSNDELAEPLCSIKNDRDEDGISDGLEIWYLHTGPDEKDSDGDGFSDYEEAFYMMTNPTEYTENEDFDGDGVASLDEITAGTNPRLKDTDFDGVSDAADADPLKYQAGNEGCIDYSELKAIGIFDKVYTSIDENGNVYEVVTNLVNDNIQYSMINGKITKYYYDLEERLCAIVCVEENDATAVTYTYNENGITSVTHNGIAYEVVSDETSEEIYIADELYQRQEYVDDVMKVTYGNGDEEEFVYNEQGLVENTFVNGVCVYEYTYDENGQVLEKKDCVQDVIYTYLYTEDGSLAEITGSNGYCIQYDYDIENDVNYIFYDINSEKYAQIVSRNTDEKYASQYSSDLVSGALEETLTVDESSVEHRITGEEASISQIYGYDDQSYVECITYNNGDTLEYEYTKDYKIKKIFVNGVEQIEYYYDNSGQIVREDNVYANASYSYVYDANRNMVQKTAYEYSKAALENQVYVDYYEYDNIWSDQITDMNGSEITYDGMGNVISYRDGMTFQWNGKKLSEVQSAGNSIEYTYNDEGIRTSKSVNGTETWYVIEGKDIIFEENESHQILYVYDADMDIAGMVLDGSTYYYEKNAQKDVLRILSEDGEILCSYAYDAWGNIVNISGDKELAQLNPIRYRSYYCDVETGLYYVESRYYDSEVGRFISADSVGNVISDYTNLNLYVYCGNDPVNYYDPSGCAKIYLKTLISSDLMNVYPSLTSLMMVTDSLWIEKMNKGGSNVNYKISSKQDFIDTWNSLVNATAIVIMAHGDPGQLQFGNEYLTKEDIRNNLQSKSVKFVWIVSCNAGHYSCTTSNVAYEIAKKTYGYVVAADGTVLMGAKIIYGSQYGFAGECVGDTKWEKYAGNRTNPYGWMIYRYKSWCNILTVWSTTLKLSETSIFDVSNCLVNAGFIAYK